MVLATLTVVVENLLVFTENTMEVMLADPASGPRFTSLVTYEKMSSVCTLLVCP